jgi:hypothetical protein
LHRVSRRAIEGEVVDHRADHDATTHELVTGPLFVEQTPALWAPDKASVET